VQVISWRAHIQFSGTDTFVFRADEYGEVWFLCDRFEEVVRDDGHLLSPSDFSHAQGKNLISTIRNSIPQVILDAKIEVVRYYP